MKTLFQCIVFFGLSMNMIAQPNTDPTRGPFNIKPNGVIDGVVIKDEVPVRSKVEYEFVRSADLVWSRRVFSRIDKREKMNHDIFFPLDFTPDEISSGNQWKAPKEVEDIDDASWIRHPDRYSLWTIIMRHIMLGDLSVYLVSDTTTPSFKVEEDGYKFKYPLRPTDVNASPKGKFFVSAADEYYRKNISKCLSSGKQGPYWPFQLASGKDYILTKIAGLDADAFIDQLSTQGVPAEGLIGSDFVTGFTVLKADPPTLDMFREQYNAAQDNGSIRQPDKVKWINSGSITAYNIKEDWFFDKERSILDRRIIAIAPVGRYKADEYNKAKGGNIRFDRFAHFIFENDRDLTDPNSGNVTNTKGQLVDAQMGDYSEEVVELEMFWLYFPELRDVMVNYYVYNDQNDSQWMTFDDLFFKRKFSSTIFRVSDKFDREIEDYKFGVEALYEAERLKEKIREWEINVWNY
jgi:hypothetical protein